MSSDGVGGDPLERGREAYERHAWLDAREALSRAGAAEPLSAEDLERLAVASYMVGRDEDFVAALERCHALRQEAGETLPAARCAFWIGINVITRGQADLANGWFARARRLVESAAEDSVESGYLLIPTLLRQEGAGEWEEAAATGAEAAAIAERFGDRDLFALALHEQGYATIKLGRAEEGLALIDEAMVAVTAGELSPLVTGLVYCSVIAYCQGLYELRRAQQWTAALTRWCEEQPQMVAYSGQCLVHRAELMQLRGAWGDALSEAQRAGERFAQAADPRAGGHRAGAALYRQAEVHRLRGEHERAEEAYRAAGRNGWEPQPGLSLLRMAQGDLPAALASIRRAVGETSDPLRRGGLLPAYVEVALAAGEPDAARDACHDLERVAEAQRSEMLLAMAAQARGTVDLAAGNARDALVSLRRAARIWEQFEAPYEVARVRELAGLACRELDDGEAAALELEAARATFEELGAVADLARVDSLSSASAPRSPGEGRGLTERELQVLRLVSGGKTNREIAAELVLSDRTVDRHVSNIFAKLGVSSRAAATAYAYEHELL